MKGKRRIVPLSLPLTRDLGKVRGPIPEQEKGLGLVPMLREDLMDLL